MGDDEDEVVFLDDDEEAIDEGWLAEERVENTDAGVLPPRASRNRLFVTLAALALFLGGTGAAFTAAYHRHMTDLRNANLLDAKVDGATFTGTKVSGVVATGSASVGLVAEWADASAAGDGSKRIDLADLTARLSGLAPAAPAIARRYFGRGDVLRNASLQFEDGASVEIESLFEACSIKLGEGTELIVGKDGVLAGCRIQGAGNVTVNGKFFEDKSPGIQGVRQLVVSSGGSLVGMVEQPPEKTAFGFEPGCKLRMTIKEAKAQQAKGGIQS